MTGATTTRWTWIRHAPATMAGCFCGQSDPALDTNTNAFAAIASRLPEGADVFVSPYARTRQTLEGLQKAGFRAGQVTTSPLVAEQNFGILEGQSYDSTRLPDDAEHLARWRPEGGESLADVVQRVRQFIAQKVPTGKDRDICVITHAGVIRSALAIALQLEAAHVLSFEINTLSTTATALSSAGHWQVGHVNRIGAMP